MPTYEYRCPQGHAFDVFQKMSDPPGATCPECGAAAERVISAGAGFLFKGEGFYITDYRSADYKKKAEKEVPGGGASSPSTSGKPAPKSEGTSASKPAAGGDA